MDVVIFSCSHALILLAPSNHTSGFSNETSFAFEFQAVLGIYKNKLKVEGPDPYVKCTLAVLIINLDSKKGDRGSNPGLSKLI